MAFTAEDYSDLIRLLREHPQWQQQLRTMLGTADTAAPAQADYQLNERLARVEQSLAELAEAQQRTEQRLEALAEQMAALAEAQQRTERRLEQLAEAQQGTDRRLEQLAQAQQRTEQRLEALAEQMAALAEQMAALAEVQQSTDRRLEQLAQAQRHTEVNLSNLAAQMEALAKAHQRMADHLGHVRGRQLEMSYRDKAAAYFGRMLQRPRAVSAEALHKELEARLTHDELMDLLLVDLVVRGKARDRPEGPDIWLAVEISAVVDRQEVERARRRAAHLRKAGCKAVAVVAGERATQGAQEEVTSHNVVMIQDGHVSLWQEALQGLEAST